MLDSIYIGMSGLSGHSRNLRSIAANTANLDTPGYKGGSVEFTSLVDSASGGGASGGLAVVGQRIDLAAGALRPSGSPLDTALQGSGFFVLRREGDTSVQLTRDGRFAVDEGGWLVHVASGSRVMARTDSGALEAIHVDALRTMPAKATASIEFSGTANLEGDPGSGTKLTFNEEFVDVAGVRRAVRFEVTWLSSSESSVRTFQVKAFEGEAELGTMTIEVGADGRLLASQDDPEFVVERAGLADQRIRLDFRSADARLYANQTSAGSTMTARPDGHVAGELKVELLQFDASGTLSLSYTNGQIEKGPRLALAAPLDPDALETTQGTVFSLQDETAVRLGVAGEEGFGVIASANVEASNVDLSAQFSDLVIAQRGYQASSQILAAASEMLQQLLASRSR